MRVSVKNPNELEKVTEQELLYLQDGQLKKKLTMVLIEKVKEIKQKKEAMANNNKQVLSRKRRRKRNSSDVVGELAFSFLEHNENCVGNNIDILSSSQAERQTREYNNRCRFSIIERLKHWSIECTKRRKENKYDMHYVHHGWKFRSMKEVLNFLLHENYSGGMNRKRNEGIVSENSVILQETDPLEAMKNKYVEGDDGSKEDKMIPKGIVEENSVILPENNPSEATKNMNKGGYDHSVEDYMMIPEGIVADNSDIIHEIHTLEAMKMYEEGYDIRTNEDDQMMSPKGTVAENLVVPYEIDPLEVIKKMHEEGYEGSNEDHMMIPNWTVLDLQLDSAIDFPIMYQLEPLGSRIL